MFITDNRYKKVLQILLSVIPIECIVSVTSDGTDGSESNPSQVCDWQVFNVFDIRPSMRRWSGFGPVVRLWPDSSPDKTRVTTHCRLIRLLRNSITLSPMLSSVFKNFSSYLKAILEFLASLQPENIKRLSECSYVSLLERKVTKNVIEWQKCIKTFIRFTTKAKSFFSFHIQQRKESENIILYKREKYTIFGFGFGLKILRENPFS